MELGLRGADVTQFIGVDIGTTSTKVACYDSRLGCLVAARRAPTVEIDDAWGGVRDPRLVLVSVTGLLRRLLQDDSVDPRDIAGMAVCSVGEEVVLVDDGLRPVGTVLCWHAGHGEAALRRLSAAGVTLPDVEDPTVSLYKLAWLARHRPRDLERASSWTGLADFVALSLMARKGPQELFLNASHASRTGLLDLAHGCLDPTRLSEVGVPGPALPTLLPSGSLVGSTSADGVLPAGIPVVAGGHDHFCGAFGSGVRSAGEAYVSAGTSEAQMILVSRPPAAVPPGIGVGAFVDGSLHYVFRATPSGRLFGRWRCLLYPDESDETLWQEIAVPEADLPPVSIDLETGAYALPTLPFDASRGQVMGMLLKGLADEAERTTTLLEHLTSAAVGSVTVAGVPTRSSTWRRIRQQATRRRLRFVAEPEATVLGVALLAQKGVTGAADLPAAVLQDGLP
jgi:xylulokinase